MLETVAAAIPGALGLLGAALPIVAIPLVFATSARHDLLRAFAAGFAGGVLALGAAVILASDLIGPGEDGPPRWMVWLRLAIGLALIGAAVFKGWQAARRKEDGPPGWLASLESMDARGAARLGLLLATVNPKNALLVISGALAIVAASYDPLAQAVALAVFVAIGSLGVLAPILALAAMGERADAPLAAARTFLERHGTVVVVGVLGVLGLIVAAGAVADLAA